VVTTFPGAFQRPQEKLQFLVKRFLASQEFFSFSGGFPSWLLAFGSGVFGVG